MSSFLLAAKAGNLQPLPFPSQAVPDLESLIHFPFRDLELELQKRFAQYKSKYINQGTTVFFRNGQTPFLRYEIRQATSTNQHSRFIQLKFTHLERNEELTYTIRSKGDQLSHTQIQDLHRGILPLGFSPKITWHEFAVKFRNEIKIRYVLSSLSQQTTTGHLANTKVVKFFTERFPVFHYVEQQKKDFRQVLFRKWQESDRRLELDLTAKLARGPKDLLGRELFLSFGREIPLNEARKLIQRNVEKPFLHDFKYALLIPIYVLFANSGEKVIIRH